MFHESLSDFGAAPTLNPPPGWSTVALEEVTAANQDQFRIEQVEVDACADLRSFTAQRTDTFYGTGETYYVPPVGWWLWTLRATTGTEQDELIWVNPQGFPWLAQRRCTGDLDKIGSTTAGGGTVPATLVKAGFPWWLALLAGGGYLAYKLAAGKKKKKRKPTRKNPTQRQRAARAARRRREAEAEAGRRRRSRTRYIIKRKRRR